MLSKKWEAPLNRVGFRLDPTGVVRVGALPHDVITRTLTVSDRSGANTVFFAPVPNKNTKLNN